MNLAELVTFVRRHRYAVQSSVTANGAPQASVVGIGISDAGEIVFDTLGSTRKMHNYRQNARAALVVGWDDEQTAQIEGIADEPTGDELARLKQVYFAAWPDGPTRETWDGITYVRIRPTWARYTDFRPGGDPNGVLVEL